MVSIGESLRIGSYELDQSLSDVSDELKELGPEIFLLLPKTFEDEAVYEGQEIAFLGTQWNSTYNQYHRRQNIQDRHGFHGQQKALAAVSQFITVLA